MRTVLLSAAFLLFILQSLAQNFENGFNFNLPFDDSTTVEYLPHFPQIPIDDNSFTSTDDMGNFILNGTPVRFFG